MCCSTDSLDQIHVEDEYDFSLHRIKSETKYRMRAIWL